RRSSGRREWASDSVALHATGSDPAERWQACDDRIFTRGPAAHRNDCSRFQQLRWEAALDDRRRAGPETDGGHDEAIAARRVSGIGPAEREERLAHLCFPARDHRTAYVGEIARRPGGDQ